MRRGFWCLSTIYFSLSSKWKWLVTKGARKESKLSSWHLNYNTAKWKKFSWFLCHLSIICIDLWIFHHHFILHYWFLYNWWSHSHASEQIDWKGLVKRLTQFLGLLLLSLFVLTLPSCLKAGFIAWLFLSATNQSSRVGSFDANQHWGGPVLSCIFFSTLEFSNHRQHLFKILFIQSTLISGRHALYFNTFLHYKI